MGERFVDRRLLVPLPTVNHENSRVENEVVCIVCHLLGGVGSGYGVGICDCVIDLTPDDLDWVSGGVCLVEALFVGKTVRVRNHDVCRIQVGKQIQRDKSDVPLARPVFDTDKVVLSDAQKFSPEGAVHVLKHAERKHCCIVCVSEGRCFRSGGAFRDDGCCSRIGRGQDQCYR